MDLCFLKVYDHYLYIYDDAEEILVTSGSQIQHERQEKSLSDATTVEASGIPILQQFINKTAEPEDKKKKK